MDKKIQYLALDVDDQHFHGCLLSDEDSQAVEFAVPASVTALVKKIEKIRDPATALKICYEATYLGFSLQRRLERCGYVCDVIAPSLIPRKPGERVKTDRLDSRKLAEYYRKGLLTRVHVPGEAQEKVRGLIRSRGFLAEQLKALKKHLLGHCRCMGLEYRQNGSEKTYWTQDYRGWLWGQIRGMEEDAFRANLEALLLQIEHLERTVDSYEGGIAEIASGKDYQRAVHSLCCYRGIDVLSAMTLISELGDIRRFDHPKRLTSYAGMAIVEKSSGGCLRKFRISKTGNRFLRTTVIEACQGVLQAPRISARLTRRREGAEKTWIEIADRAMSRLHRKATHLWHANKAKNKIKVACARELLGFIWESLRSVAASE
jgi:transposase